MDCFLFDVDGTLVDSREVIARSLASAIRQHSGRNLNPAELLNLVDQSPKAVLGQYGIQSLDSYWCAYSQFLHHSRLFKENTAEVLNLLKRRGVRLGVVSSLKKSNVDLLLHHLGIYGCFDVIYGWHPTKKKPNPGQILQAMSALGVCQENTAYIGDQEKDMLAAKRANVMAIRVSWALSAFSQTEPDLTIADFTELLSL